MNEHLSSERIFEAIAGRRNAEVEKHLHACAACNEEVGRLRRSIAGFSQAIHEEAERDRASAPRQIGWAEQRPQSRLRPFTWILAAAVIATAVALPVYDKSQPPPQEAIGEADAGLLEEVDAHLSREVPASLESLLELMQEDKE